MQDCFSTYTVANIFHRDVYRSPVRGGGGGRPPPPQTQVKTVKTRQSALQCPSNCPCQGVTIREPLNWSAISWYQKCLLQSVSTIQMLMTSDNSSRHFTWEHNRFCAREWEIPTRESFAHSQRSNSEKCARNVALHLHFLTCSFVRASFTVSAVLVAFTTHRPDESSQVLLKGR
jgi:hypothetical protein